MSLSKYLFFTILLASSWTLQAQEINWMTWEEAAAANEKQPRKIFVDIYTDWCGWCKKMDATTFKDPSIVTLMNEKFYAVKLNAEQKDTIKWKGFDWIWMPGGRSGYHKLAFELLEGRLSFPSFVMLDEEFIRIAISPGFKVPEPFLKELKYASDDYYKRISWESYLSSAGQP